MHTDMQMYRKPYAHTHTHTHTYTHTNSHIYTCVRVFILWWAGVISVCSLLLQNFILLYINLILRLFFSKAAGVSHRLHVVISFCLSFSSHQNRLSISFFFYTRVNCLHSLRYFLVKSHRYFSFTKFHKYVLRHIVRLTVRHTFWRIIYIQSFPLLYSFSLLSKKEKQSVSEIYLKIRTILSSFSLFLSFCKEPSWTFFFGRQYKLKDSKNDYGFKQGSNKINPALLNDSYSAMK